MGIGGRRERMEAPAARAGRRYGPDTWVTFQTGDMGDTESDRGQFSGPSSVGRDVPRTWVTPVSGDMGNKPRTWVTGRAEDIGDRCSNRGPRRAANGLEGDLSDG